MAGAGREESEDGGEIIGIKEGSWGSRYRLWGIGDCTAN